MERINEPSPPESFIQLRRDLFIASGDVGFWQGTFRDPSAPEYAEARESIDAKRNTGVEILYGDQEGGQRVISRFGLVSRGDMWIAEEGRHRRLDGSALR